METTTPVYAHQFNVNIGDWSDDGHGQCCPIVIMGSHDVQEVQDAFISAATRLGFLDGNVHPNFIICNEYGDSSILEEWVEDLHTAGIIVNDILELHGTEYHFNEKAKGMAHLIMRIAQLDLPGFVYEIPTAVKLPNFNGFWSPKLNTSIGYGLFE